MKCYEEYLDLRMAVACEEKFRANPENEWHPKYRKSCDRWFMTVLVLFYAGFLWSNFSVQLDSTSVLFQLAFQLVLVIAFILMSLFAGWVAIWVVVGLSYFVLIYLPSRVVGVVDWLNGH